MMRAMSDDHAARVAKAALETAHQALAIAADNSIALSGMKALMPFAIAGRFPTVDEVEAIMSVVVPAAVRDVDADVEHRVRDWIEAVLASARDARNTG